MTLGCRASAVGALVVACVVVFFVSSAVAYAQSPLPTKCHGTGNIAPDERIAGCTAIIESTSGMTWGVVGAYFRRASLYLQKGEPELAIADYSQVIDHYPNNLAAHLCRALAFRRNGDVDAALADYDKAAELDPKNVSVNLGRAGAYMINGDLDRAITEYEHVLQIQPMNVPAHVGRSAAYRGKGDPERAIADCNRAIEISPDREPGYVCRGDVYLDADDFDRALGDFDRAVQLNPKNPSLYFLRGVVRLEANLRPGAIEDFTRSGELNPKRPYNWLWLELALKQNGQPSQLADTAKQLDMEKWPAPIIRLFLGEETLDAVLAAADDPSATKKKGQVCEANFYAGELALIRGATEDALRLLRLAADGCPKTFVEWPPAKAELRRLDAKP